MLGNKEKSMFFPKLSTIMASLLALTSSSWALPIPTIPDIPAVPAIPSLVPEIGGAGSLTGLVVVAAVFAVLLERRRRYS